MLLSIVMMVKNEEKYLDRCLTSLKPILDSISSELIILDTGSTDKTVEIAKKHTNKVYYHPWENDFAKMRNISISYAKGEWLFILDADEMIDNPETIIEFFKTNKYKKYRTCVLKIKNFLDSKEKHWNIVPIMRLFKKTSDFRYTGAVHEQPLAVPPFYYLDTILNHYGYVATDPVLMKRKFKRNVKILEQELQKDPNNYYYLFQLSQSYGMYGDKKTALYYAEKAYKIIKEKNINLIHIYIHLIQMFISNKKYRRVEQIVKETLNISDEYIDVYYYFGKAQQALHKSQEAIKTYKKYLEMAKNYKNYAGYKDMITPTNTLNFVQEIYKELCLLYYDVEKYEKVLTIKDKIDFDEISLLDSAFYFIILSYIKLNKWNGLKEYYEKIRLEKEELKESFINNLEAVKRDIQLDEKEKLEELFISYEDNYGLLNKIRIALQRKDFKELDNIEKDIKILDFKELPYFYGDIIWYYIIKQKSIYELLSNVSEEKISQYIQYILNEKKKMCFDILVEYVKNQYPIINIKTALINKILLKALLLDESIEDNYYKGILERYIFNGSCLIEYTYKEYILKKELQEYLKNDEERFFMYMVKAIESKRENLSKSIKYLRKALRVFSIMKKGIQLYIDEYKKLINQSKELEELKINLQTNINNLIQAGKIEEANLFIKEYENIIKSDSFIYSAKSSIAIMKNNIEEAEELIKEGLLKYPRDFDLLCNGAYLLQHNKQEKLALELYKEAYKVASNKEYKNQIKEIINNLSNEEGKTTVSINDELEMYKGKVKEQINNLMNKKQYEECMKIIEEYEKIIPNDLEILLLKSQLYIKQNQ
ncbi:glycosyltransferase [Defluviitalea phaphyphila]|uniref:glycosyltransferase n=1 Tax=Defluviitalea phaphyphila TaxID=1473580 RepID=UPI0007307D59|nr:glycosyltransferase [Defluviitalea phaphyphila]